MTERASLVYAPPRKDGLKPWRLAYYFKGGELCEIVYAATAAEARAVSVSLPKVHSVRRATVEQMARVGHCDVCGHLGKSQHDGPDGDTFWLCPECEAECAEVAREGQYVTPEEVSRGF